MSKPRVLLILVEPPLPFGNAASRWYHVLIQQLHAREYDFDILVACGVPKDMEKAREAFKSWNNIYLFPFNHSRGPVAKIKNILYPFGYQFSAEFMQKLKRLNPDSYDIIHAESPWAGWATWKWAHKTALFVHYIMGIDLEHVKGTTAKDRLLFRRWFSAEKKVMSRHPNIVACSLRIQKHIASWNQGQKNLTAIPFAIDLSLYPFIHREKRQTAQPIVTIIGTMSWLPSLSAARRLITELWPSIKKQVPNAKLRVVGWSARERLQEFLHMDMEVLENVPETRPYFEQASVLVYAPSRGSGMKIKILEALAFGVPVVTTNEGVEGLNVKDMVNVAVGEDNEELIAKTVKILKNTELQESLRTEGRKMLEQQCSPESVFDQVEHFYARILQSQK